MGCQLILFPRWSGVECAYVWGQSHSIEAEAGRPIGQYCVSCALLYCVAYLWDHHAGQSRQT